MFKIDTNTTWAIFAYESLADVGYKITEWFSDAEEAKKAWMEFKRDVLSDWQHHKSVVDSRYSITIVKLDGSMVTYAIEPWG